MAYSLNKILFPYSSNNVGITLIPDGVLYYKFNISYSQKELAIKICTERTEHPFCIYLTQSEKTIDKDSLDQLILCLTQPLYYKENAQHVLVLESNTTMSKNAKDYLLLQGFHLSYFTINQADTDNLWLIKETDEPGQIQKKYEEKLSMQQFINKWIVIEEQQSAKLLTAITECLSFTEVKFKQNNPAFETLLLTNGALQKQNSLLSEQNNYLLRELEHYKVFNKQLKDQDESEKILRFYHTEYELLPLWYKRFGHIIKILTGKRKLSSLYKKRSV